MSSSRTKTAQPPSLEERRRVARERVLRPGVIVYGSLPHRLDCTIFDFSPGGTRVHFKPGQIIPNACFLFDVRNSWLYAASLAWKQAPAAGLVFGESYDLAQGLPPHLDYLSRVWREIASTS